MTNKTGKTGAPGGRADIPVFTAPKRSAGWSGGSRQSCHFHGSQPSSADCAKCGKAICENCVESYSVTTPEYEGKAICYNCARELVAENVTTLKKQRRKIIFTFVATVIGIIFGLAIASSQGYGFIGTLLFAAWLGSMWTLVKSVMRGWVKEGAGFLPSLLGSILAAPVITARKLIESIYYWIKTAGFIKSDSEALVDMQAYMEYTLAMEGSSGMDLETMMSQDEALHDNSYAQMVLAQGENQAFNQMRRTVMTIAENGEIIRSFAA